MSLYFKWVLIVSMIFASAGLVLAEVSPQVVESVLQNETRPQHAFPKIDGYEVLACDFHMHTTHSDGKISPKERVLEAYRLGYDVIAITDHGKTQAYKEALDLANSLGIILIRAFETGVESYEHLVVLNVPEKYKPVDAHTWSETTGAKTAFYQDQLRNIANQGGLVILAHPHVGYREPILWGIKNGYIQGVEVKNGVVGSGWNTVLSHGTYCYPSAFDFANEKNLGMFANSDSHGPKLAGSEITYVLVKKRSVAGVVEGIRARRTLAYFNNMIWGPEKLLSHFFKSAVSVTKTNDASGTYFYRISNKTPITLKAGMPDTVNTSSIDILPYGEVFVSSNNKIENLNITWQNIWINLKDNLKTSYSN